MELKMDMAFLKPIGNFFKKYAALLPSIAITVVALLLFLPTMMVGGSVKEKMQKSASTAKKVSGQLSVVPSKDAPNQMKQFTDKLEGEANHIEMLAIQSSQRELVSYDIFPEPTDSSSQLFTQYGADYAEKIESLMTGMDALDAPSDAEIRSKTGGGTGRRTTRTVRSEQVNTQDPMVDALCLTRASEIGVYANPEVFNWYGFWAEDYTFEGQSAALEDSWDSQIALWIYEDVVETIKKMNGAGGQVSSSPVKRLLGVSFNGPVEIPDTSGRRSYSRVSMGMRDIPVCVSETVFSPFMDVSPTRRKGNEDVDVVHFAVSVLVDSRYTMAFMKELCSEKQHTFLTDFKIDGQPVMSKHNQITILQSDVVVVDKQADEHALYRYGKGAVVRLDLVCEYLFSRKGYDLIKPDPIKKRLKQESKSENNGRQPQNNKSGSPGYFNPKM
jgi:hypothetical protein